LPERRITLVNGMVHAEGHRCRLFRFSGYDPDRPESATSYFYTPRLEVSRLGDAAIVFERYRNALFDAGWAETRIWPYAYRCFDNGVAIPDVARDIYAGLSDAERFGDPFETQGPTSFFRWLKAPAQDRKGPSHPGTASMTADPTSSRLFPTFSAAIGRPSAAGRVPAV
jgi:hypothetical protein